MNTTVTNIAHGDSIIEERLAVSTKRQYQNKVDHFEHWVRIVHFEELVDEDTDEIMYENIGCEVLKEFLGHVSKKRKRKEETAEEPFVYCDPEKLQSVQHVNGYKSALTDKFKRLGISLDFESKTMFSDMMIGYRRVIQKKKQDGEIEIREGKFPLSFSGYRFLAKKAMQQSTDFQQTVFAHIFLLFCWNMIARCVSVSLLTFTHISWEEDSMVVVFPTTKSDKVGKNSSPIHIFANRKSPEICPILWFAVYIWCMGFRRQGSQTTVFGAQKETQSRFSKWLQKVCGSNTSELLLMGIIIAEIGTHSFRKGVANFLSALCGGPSSVAIYLRAGWSLGPVTSRYIMEGEGNDQLAGRAATGLPITEPEFADLPPHFDQSEGAVLSVDQWEEILPGYSTFYPQSFRQVLPFLLASLVYHRNYLKDNLSASHPIFLTRLWTSNTINELSEKIYCGTGKHPVTQMTATGIPPHILLANEIVALRAEMACMKDALIERLSDIPEQVRVSMLNNFRIDGTIPITITQVESMMQAMQASLLAAIAEQTVRQQTAIAAVSSTHSTASTLQVQSFHWSGRFHPVPNTFRFPRYYLFCYHFIVR